MSHAFSLMLILLFICV